MILLVGPLAVLPAVVAVILLAALQWARLSMSAPPPPALVTGAAVAVGWTVLVVVLRFALGV